MAAAAGLVQMKLQQQHMQRAAMQQHVHMGAPRVGATGPAPAKVHTMGSPTHIKGVCLVFSV
eukprot:11162922-Lingulodinium_polyedra.AAC.1